MARTTTLYAPLVTVLLSLAFGLLAATNANAGGACPGYEDRIFCGDVTNDCTVSANDALLGLRMAVGQITAVVPADLDNSGGVTAPDALKILRIAVGSLPETSSCGPQYGLVAEAVGFYNQTGARSTSGYAAGWYTIDDAELRNYLVFDLSQVAGEIVTAHLRLAPGTPTMNSDAGTETFTLFDIATDPAVLSNGSGGVAAFADLAEGTVYGTFVATSPVPAVVIIPLNDAGVTYLDGRSGKVALGGSLTTLSKGVSSEYLFNATRNTTIRELVVTVD